MIWDREKYIAHCKFQYTGREIFTQIFDLMVGLKEEWTSQGASKEEIDLSAFDFDVVLSVNCPANCMVVTRIEPKVLEDDAEFSVKTDHLGRKTKLFKQNATIPLPMDYPVRNVDDWIKIKHWYAFNENRVDKEALRQIAGLRERGYTVHAWIPDAFDEPRELMGEEGFCIACYEQPELIDDILQTITVTCLKVLERAVALYR